MRPGNCWHGQGRRADSLWAHERCAWIPLDFGEPLQDFVHLGIKEHIAVLAPLVVKYGVDEARRVVYVALPFDLLPKSGL